MSTQQGFNADQRAKERASQPIVIGEITFVKRRSTNELQRQLQRLAREQARINRRQEQHGELIDALDAITPDQGEIKRLQQITDLDTSDVETVIDKLDELGEEARVLTYKMIAAQLRHSDSDEPSIVEFLETHLDAEDVMPLVRYLAGAPADPTPQTPTTEPISD